MANLPDKVLQQRFKIQLESLESPSDLPGGFRLNAEEKNSEYMRVPEKLLQQRFRLQLESLDSPSQLPGGFSDAVMSPMTDLAVNLCDTSLGSGLTPVQDSKRRLSMDSDSTPSPHLAGTLERSLSDSTTPLSSITNKPKRLLLGSGRLTTLKSLSAPRDLGQCNKENIPLGQHAILSPNKGSPFKLADSPLGLKPRKSPLGIKQFFSSPSKVPKVSPGKVAPMGRSLSVKRPMFTVLEDEDCNSRDSGFLSQPVEDERLARKKSRQEMTTSMADILSNCSPGKEEGVTPLADSPKDKSPSKTGSSFQTSCSDGFDLDSLSTISEEDDTDSPKMGFNSLFSNPIILPQHLKDSSAFIAPTHTFPPSSRSDFPSNPPTVRPLFRRALSMFNAPSPSCLDSDSPISRNSLVELKAGFKRPDPPQFGGGGGCLGKKRRVTPGGLMCERSISLQENNPCSGPGRKKPSFVRSHSENELSIMKSCQLKEEVEDILPDSSRLYALPTFASGSKHPSLRSITCDTLADVLLGRHKNHVESYRIVDVRYKFEYDGGHIQGAENWQHGEDDQFLSAFLPSAPLPAPPQHCMENTERRNILIFHCEFSSQRGPDFYMKLREKDRQLNKDVYPGLHYPECYLLHLGYKEFYKNFPALCTGSYTEMIDPRHENDLRKMRAKSKSWSGGTVARTGRMGRLHL